MHRKAIVLSLGLALVFATLPGLIALSFAGSSAPGEATALVPITLDNSVIEEHPLAMGVKEPGGCALDDPGIDSARF